MQQTSDSFRFQRLVAQLLRAIGYKVEEYESYDEGYDFIAYFGNTSQNAWLVEVKYYKTKNAQLSLVESAAARLAKAVSQKNVAQPGQMGMLIVSYKLDVVQKDALEKRYGLRFIDRSNLLDIVPYLVNPEISDGLISLLGESPATDPQNNSTSSLLSQIHPPTPEDLPKTTAHGAKLCEELRNLPRGKAGWTEYETKCGEILRYLFPTDLVGWHKQIRTDDGLNRFDFICRIQSTVKFWEFLATSLLSRYVLFEFKNYSEKISQGQVLTTEKYLLEKALRHVAIIFSREGSDQNSLKMTYGAMRESGKLILILSDKDVCKMLNMRDRGEDPSDLLFELTDQFLLSLSR